MNEWICGNLHTDQIKYITDPQVHTTNNARRATNELMNQRVNIDGVECYNTHQELILSDLVTESDIYDNYSDASCVDWEIEKTPETHPKKLEFNVKKPETGLKKIGSNINVNDNEIDDMNDEEAVHLSNDLTDYEYSNIEDHETQQERTNQNNSFYTLVDNELAQSSPHIEDLNKTYDWKITNNHEGELMMAYDTNAGSEILYQRTFYALYIGPNNDNIGHLIFELSTKQLLTKMKYQPVPVPVPENLFKTINETDSFTTKIQIDQFDSDRFTAQDEHFNNTKDDDETQSNNVDNTEDESYNKLDSSQPLDYIESNTMFHQENKILLTVGSSKSMSVAMIKLTGITSTSTFLQGLFI